jgi:chromosomal replication initiation ATPase DnaA
MKVYISGQISGMPIEQAESNFRTAEKEVVAMGHEPVNPFNNGLPHTATWAEHMIKDIEMLMGCDAIYLQSNWKTSKGARIELNIADEMGLTIINKRELYQSDRINAIKEAIKSETGISFSRLLTLSRNPAVMQSKTLFIAIVSISENYSTSAIGQLIERDHVTVMHHLKKYANYMQTDKAFRQLAESIISKLLWL